ncbi:MAG: glycosyltransferase family 2 protein [bacterium]|nr:glycosyltransferase family 2 protein [bacterium]
MKIKVSVIVPVWNVEKFISKCLDSLVNQTLKEIEIIVVNDGSPDNSQEIIDEYVKKYPDKLKSFIKENGGQGSARNLGIEKAKGEYLSFVDSDDWIDLDALEKMYSLGKKENSDIVICDMIDHYQNYTIYHNCTKYNSIFEVTPSASNKIFKRSVINDIRFLSKLWYEDFNFTTKILFNTDKIAVISEGMYHCNCGHISTMNNNNSLKNLDIITIIDDITDYLKENNKYDKNIISYLIFDHILITTINRVSIQHSGDKKEVLNKLINYCHDNIPDYKKQEFYKNINKNRKIVAWLNYHKMYNISKILLKIKKQVKR